MTVVLVDQLPILEHEYAAVVLRRSAKEPRDVILLPRATADARVLDSAIRVLLHARLRQGTRPRTINGREFETLTLGVNTTTPPESWNLSELPRTRAFFEQLLSAPAESLPGIGTGPTLTYRPPDPEQHRRLGPRLTRHTRVSMLFVLVPATRFRHPASIQVFDLPDFPVQPVIFVREDAASPQLLQQAAADLVRIMEQHGLSEHSEYPAAPGLKRPVRMTKTFPAAPWAKRALAALIDATPVSLEPLGLTGRYRTFPYGTTVGLLRASPPLSSPGR